MNTIIIILLYHISHNYIIVLYKTSILDAYYA